MVEGITEAGHCPRFLYCFSSGYNVGTKTIKIEKGSQVIPCKPAYLLSPRVGLGHYGRDIVPLPA